MRLTMWKWPAIMNSFFIGKKEYRELSSCSCFHDTILAERQLLNTTYMKKLTPETYEEYLETTYASWLGKNIGIRLGAPIESWTYDEVLAKYPEITDYPVDYDIFAADDDSNGPMFFVRALDKGNDITAQDIGESFLNYIQEYSGFFWWGGVGVSTEHTAYENLKNGIPAPLSGSKQCNGIATAEQIGGQIFSDCWGYVAGYDPVLAKDLAVKAGSVTHDGNGLEGAKFVAVAIALAYQYDDIMDVLNDTLEYLDKRNKYYKVCKDIMRFYEKNPDDWLSCFRYIQKNYGYDKFPGTCHIIPNTAIMILAMCYGKNDFSRTLCILAQCGWDTDCTCGNVGSIMGALVGLKGIDPKWIVPINDVVNSSSCVGCLNIDSVSHSAQMFARYAMQLKGYDQPAYRCFCLPYATEGFRSEGTSLKVDEKGLVIPDNKEVYFYSYYLGDDIFDARYDPVFSPRYYPGDIMHFVFETDRLTKVTLFCTDCQGNRFERKAIIEGREEILFELPAGKNRVIHTVGFTVENKCHCVEYHVEHHSEVEIDFTGYSVDGYGPRYAGDTLYNVRGFNPHSGTWSLNDNGLIGKKADHALITTGSIDAVTSEIEMSFRKAGEINDYLVIGYNGYQDFYAIGVHNEQIVLMKKDSDYRMLVKKGIKYENDSQNTLKAKISNDKIYTCFNGETVVFDIEAPVSGAVGILSLGAGEIQINGFKFSSLDLKR